MRKILPLILFLFFFGLSDLGREMTDTQNPPDEEEMQQEDQIIGTKQSQGYMNKVVLLGAPVESKEDLILYNGVERRRN